MVVVDGFLHIGVGAPMLVPPIAEDGVDSSRGIVGSAIGAVVDIAAYGQGRLLGKVGDIHERHVL